MRISTQDILYKKWAKSFLQYQAETTRMARKIINKPILFNFNPCSNNKINKILKRYEKNFW